MSEIKTAVRDITAGGLNRRVVVAMGIAANARPYWPDGPLTREQLDRMAESAISEIAAAYEIFFPRVAVAQVLIEALTRAMNRRI